MSDSTADSSALAAEARAFRAGFQTLLMATVSADGIPGASYAPFICPEDNCFYIYVSALSRHTHNLETTSRASVLFIEDENAANQPFARTRLTFDCHAALITRDSETWYAILDTFEATFGSVVEMIRPLTDFQLFQLTPESGTYVKGFAQAYRVTDAAMLTVEPIIVGSG